MVTAKTVYQDAPSASHQLFPAKTGRPNTILAGNVHERRSQIIRGYRSAAELLAVEVIDHWGGYSDTLAFPVIFLYRQVFELELKSIVDFSGSRVGVEPIRNSHSLSAAWVRCLKVLEFWELRNWPGEEHVGRLLCQFDDIDPQSYTFRFHSDTKGNATKAVRRVCLEEGGGLTSFDFDLRSFVEAADAVGNFLDRVSGEVWQRESWAMSAERD